MSYCIGISIFDVIHIYIASSDYQLTERSMVPLNYVYDELVIQYTPVLF